MHQPNLHVQPTHSCVQFGARLRQACLVMVSPQPQPEALLCLRRTDPEDLVYKHSHHRQTSQRVPPTGRVAIPSRQGSTAITSSRPAPRETRVRGGRASLQPLHRALRPDSASRVRPLCQLHRLVAPGGRVLVSRVLAAPPAPRHEEQACSRPTSPGPRAKKDQIHPGGRGDSGTQVLGGIL